jgi:uncharacterized protein with NRDE domain
MLAALTDASPATAEELAATAQERVLNATPPFVRDPVYGTRCTTLVLMAADGTVEVEEHRYDTGGLACGTSAWRFRTPAVGERSGTVTP